MNCLLIERKLLLNCIRSNCKTYPNNAFKGQSIHSDCWQRYEKKKTLFWSTIGTNLVQKRGINFARLRTYWRIIRLKDRGVEHNFRTDRIDRRSNVLVYKAEVNRICTLAGIVFPLMTIVVCIGYKFWPKDRRLIDPHHKKSLLERYLSEFFIMLSILQISLCKRYVLRIYFNKHKNVFSVSTWRWYVPFQTHTFQCKPGSAVECDNWFKSNDLFEIAFGNCKIDKKRLFLSQNHFTFAVYYNLLFGFTQPNELSPQSEDIESEHQRTETILRLRNRDN